MPPHSSPKAEKTNSLVELVARRLTEIERGITVNLKNIGLWEALNVPTDIAKQTQNKPDLIEPIEPQLVEDAYAIDRDLAWDSFREIGIGIKRLNENIGKNNESPSLFLSHELLRQIEGIRKLIVRIQHEQLTHGESPQLKERRQKLKNLYDKRERLDATPDSPGFDMAENRRRNERHIAETLEDIGRLENVSDKVEAREPVQTAPLRPIEIRDALDGFILDGERLLERWNPSNEAIIASEIEQQTLQWLTAVSAFVKRNLDVQHVDQLNQYQKTVEATDRWKFSFDLAKRGVDINIHRAAYELGYKLYVLRYFRDEIR